MPDHADTAGDHAILANLGTARDTDAPRHRGVVADLHVVRDHDLVIQLDPVTDYRIGQRATINGGIGANFDIITDLHPTNLRDLQPDTLLTGKTEPFTTNYCTRLNHYPSTYAHIVIQGNSRCEPTIFTDHRARADHAMRADRDAGSDLRTALDHSISAAVNKTTPARQSPRYLRYCGLARKLS